MCWKSVALRCTKSVRTTLRTSASSSTSSTLRPDRNGCAVPWSSATLASMSHGRGMYSVIVFPRRVRYRLRSRLGLLDEAIHRAQAQSGSAAGFLRREEGLEHTLLDFFRHARSGVGHDHRDKPIVRGTRILELAANRRRQRRHGLAAKLQLPPFRHRVEGIDCDVQECRFELAGVSQHRRTRRRRLHLDDDALVERASQHAGQRVQPHADIDLSRLKHLASREREQSWREPARCSEMPGPAACRRCCAAATSA
jgi:hypothetical protein